jgi:hypothetical protein
MLNDWNHLLIGVVWVAVGLGAMYALHKILMPHGNEKGFFYSAEGIAIALILFPFAKQDINLQPAAVEHPIRPGTTPEALLYVFLVLVGSIFILYLFKKLLS